MKKASMEDRGASVGAFLLWTVRNERRRGVFTFHFLLGHKNRDGCDDLIGKE